jgi:hypothetical protein
MCQVVPLQLVRTPLVACTFFLFSGAGFRRLGSFGTGQKYEGHFIWLSTIDFAVS